MLIIEKARKLVNRCYQNRDPRGNLLRKEDFMIPYIKDMMEKHGSEKVSEAVIAEMEKERKPLYFDVDWLTDKFEDDLGKTPMVVVKLTKEEANEIKKKHYPTGEYSWEAWASSQVPYGDLTHFEVYLEQRDREMAAKGSVATKKNGYLYAAKRALANAEIPITEKFS